MKKFVKGCLVVIGILAAVGAALCLTGMAMGASWNGLNIGTSSFSYEETGKRFYQGEEKVEADFEESFRGIQSLDVDLENADMQILTGEGEECIVRAAGTDSGFRCYVEEGTLNIENEEKSKVWLAPGKERALIVLELPEHMRFDQVDLSVGVGVLEFLDASAEKLSIDCGIGSVVYDGRVNGNVEITCGIGEVSLELAGNEEDFNYSLNCGIGDITIGDTSVGGIVSERTIRNNADQDMELDCGIGSISVGFSGEDQGAEQGNQGELPTLSGSDSATALQESKGGRTDL